MQRSGNIGFASWRLSRLSFAALIVLMTIVPIAAQSNRATMMMAGGAWHLHSRVPLGSDTLLLQPSHRIVEMLATAEAPEFEGWTLDPRQSKPMLLDVAGKPVRALPRSITFRVTVSTRDRFADSEPMPIDSAKSLNDFLLDMHFSVQVFRGMTMREVQPAKAWMIGIPADESSDARIYRARFDVGEIRPDDRIVLLVTDGSGRRLTKFHLEFL